MPELAHPSKPTMDWDSSDGEALDRDAIAALNRAGAAEPEIAGRTPSQARNGRGAVSNPAVRFESTVVSPVDDGWDTLTGEIEEPVKLATTLIKDSSKSGIGGNSWPDIGFYLRFQP